MNQPTDLKSLLAKLVTKFNMLETEKQVLMRGNQKLQDTLKATRLAHQQTEDELAKIIQDALSGNPTKPVIPQ